MHKLSVEAPPKILVERYLIEIAKNYNVPYEPDAMVRVRTSYFLFCSVVADLGCYSYFYTQLYQFMCMSSVHNTLLILRSRRGSRKAIDVDEAIMLN